jgi:hypothetical protein
MSESRQITVTEHYNIFLESPYIIECCIKKGGEVLFSAESITENFRYDYFREVLKEYRKYCFNYCSENDGETLVVYGEIFIRNARTGAKIKTLELVEEKFGRKITE